MTEYQIKEQEREREYRALYDSLLPYFPGWTLDTNIEAMVPSGRYALIDAAGRRFDLELEKVTGHKEQRICVSGSWVGAPGEGERHLTPGDVKETTPRITISANKPPVKIADDIKRRFLPDYTRIFALLENLKRTRREEIDHRASEWARLMATGTVREYRQGYSGHDAYRGSVVTAKNYSGGYGEVWMFESGNVRVHLDSMPVEVAMRVLKAFQGEPKVQIPESSLTDTID